MLLFLFLFLASDKKLAVDYLAKGIKYPDIQLTLWFVLEVQIFV